MHTLHIPLTRNATLRLARLCIIRIASSCLGPVIIVYSPGRSRCSYIAANVHVSQYEIHSFPILQFVRATFSPRRPTSSARFAAHDPLGCASGTRSRAALARTWAEGDRLGMGARRPGSGAGLGLCGLPAARAQTCCSSDHVCRAGSFAAQGEPGRGAWREQLRGATRALLPAAPSPRTTPWLVRASCSALAPRLTVVVVVLSIVMTVRVSSCVNSGLWRGLRL